MSDRTCSVVGCDHPYASRGYCGMHYRRWKVHGDPNYQSQQQLNRAVDLETYFLSKVDQLPNGCWEWTGRRHHNYGVFMISGINTAAHRWSYERWTGPIGPGLHMDHYRFPQDGCIGPPCVNPNHVRPTTPRENTLRGDTFAARNTAKTHCPQGHPYEGENLRIKSDGRRVCRTCCRVAQRRRRMSLIRNVPLITG